MILAVDIGGTQFRVAVIDDSGRIVRVVRRSTDQAGGAEWMIEKVLQAAIRLAKQFDLSAVGIGFGGPVDFARQRIINSTHVTGWDDVALPGMISREIGVPAVVDNDANVGALGETVFGAGRGLLDVVYYTISTGIGGGIVIGGEIYRGANGNAGELGHVPILRDRPRCACGNVGCLEALCSGPAIGQQGSRRLGRKGMTAKDVFDEAREGNQKAIDVVNEAVVYLGMGIAATISAFAPAAVIIGGGVARAGRIFFDRLRPSVERRVMSVHRSNVRILQAKRGDNSVLVGAAALARSLL